MPLRDRYLCTPICNTQLPREKIANPMLHGNYLVPFFPSVAPFVLGPGKYGYPSFHACQRGRMSLHHLLVAHVEKGGREHGVGALTQTVVFVGRCQEICLGIRTINFPLKDNQILLYSGPTLKFKIGTRQGLPSSIKQRA